MADVDMASAHGQGDVAPTDVPKQAKEPATRQRVVTTAPFFVGRRFDRTIRFGHFAFKIEPQQETGPSLYSSLKVLSCLPGANFEFTQDSLPWKLDVGMTITQVEDGKVLLDNCRVCLHNAFPATGYGISNIVGRKVRVRLDFHKAEGFGLKPLRDYSVPNAQSDVVFVAEGKKFHLNKEILAHHSLVFKTMLFGDFCEKKKDEIPLEEVSAEAFTNLLDIIDGHAFTPDTFEEVSGVLHLADQFDFSDILKIVEHNLLLYPEMGSMNRGQRICLAEKYKLNTLLNQCIASWDVEKGPAIGMTRDMWERELSGDTRWLLFQKLHPRNHPHTHHPDMDPEELAFIREIDAEVAAAHEEEDEEEHAHEH